MFAINSLLMAWHQTPYGPWDALTPPEVAELMRGVNVSWWISGGYAIEAFVSRSLREHDDIDVGLLRADQGAMRNHLAAWDTHAADPLGTRRPWPVTETLPDTVRDIWCRPTPDAPWQVQLMLNEHTGDDWLYRRDLEIRRRLGDLTFTRDGIPYLVPEVQLLFKSKSPRPKDQADFDAAAPQLRGPQREWLAAAIGRDEPNHPWLALLL